MVKRRVAQEPSQLLVISFLLVDMQLISFVERKELFREHGSVQVNRVLVHGCRYVGAVGVAVVVKLVQIVLVVVWVSAAIVTRLGGLLLFGRLAFLRLLFGLVGFE